MAASCKVRLSSGGFAGSAEFSGAALTTSKSLRIRFGKKKGELLGKERSVVVVYVLFLKYSDEEYEE